MRRERKLRWLRQLALAVIILLLALVATLFINTVRLRSLQIRYRPIAAPAIDVDAAAVRLAAAIRIPTVSHLNPADNDNTQFLALHALMERSFPLVHQRLQREVINEFSLLYTWPGSDQGRQPILIYAHMDVVPGAAEDDIAHFFPGAEWTHPPFEGMISEGFIWGRGALDMKHAVMGSLEAAEHLLTQGFQPRQTIYFAFGHDEEWGGLQGAARMADLLGERGVRLEFVLDEGGAISHGIMPGIDTPIAHVGIAEKGFLIVKISVETEMGHAGMPPAQTAVGILAAALARLEANQMPSRIAGATALNLRYLGPEMPFRQRLSLANLWLFDPLIRRRLLQNNATAALVRTTTAVTMIEGGILPNVLPNSAAAAVNFRILQGETIEDVMVHVQRVVDDPRVRIDVVDAAAAWNPSAVSRADSRGFGLLQQTIGELFPEVIVTPYLVVVATDSRHFAPLADDVYRFLPMRLGPDDLRRIHGIDERISLDNYREMIAFFIRLIENANGR